MDILIVYTEDFEEVPGGIERVKVPDEGQFSHWRASFKEVEPKTWGLAVETPVYSSSLERSSKMGYLVFLKALTGNRVGYAAWLEKNVSYIEVDGFLFWENTSEYADYGTGVGAAPVELGIAAGAAALPPEEEGPTVLVGSGDDGCGEGDGVLAYGSDDEGADGEGEDSDFDDPEEWDEDDEDALDMRGRR